MKHLSKFNLIVSLLIIFVCQQIQSQNIYGIEGADSTFLLSSNIVGYYINSGEIFFLGKENVVKGNLEDPYLEYYQKIYNDSTITNPNTVLKNNTQLISNLVLIDIDHLKVPTGNFTYFSESNSLAQFISIENNEFHITPYFLKILSIPNKSKE